MLMDNDLAILAERALQLVSDGGRIGLGTGRAANAFIHALAERVRQGLHVSGIPTSDATSQLAGGLGIPLGTLDSDTPLDLTVDGADEVEEGTLNLIKGWGGALARERIVAAASRRLVILVTGEKLVQRLGSRGKVPVEIVPFAEPFVRRRIQQLPEGLGPALRVETSRPFVTDNGHWILDCSLRPPPDVFVLDRALRSIPGVVDTGFFLGTASVVLVAEAGRLREITKKRL
jgi:ribose 5-phosphate isomerase A